MSRLIVDDLHFARAGRPILSGVTFVHEPGRILTLLGPSGSGKTTLLWILAGLLEPDRGRVDFGAEARPTLGVVFQDGGLWEHLTARAHLEIVLRGRALSRAARDERVDRALAETNLQSLAGRRPGQLSGGERQRLALARALVIQPQWLLLDEPTSQLDGPSRDAIVALLDQRLRDHPAGVILATHQVDLAMRVSDRIAVLQDGAIGQIGAPQDVYERPATMSVARMLGPAFEMRLGDRTRIVRPHQARFHVDAAGAFTVRCCHFTGGHWQVEASDGRDVAIVAADVAIPIGTKGHVHHRGPGVAPRQRD